MRAAGLDAIFRRVGCELRQSYLCHRNTNLLRRSGYEKLTDDLIEVLNRPEEKARFRAFCVQHLWQSARKAGPEDTERIRRALHRALEDRDVPVRRDALLALVRMEDPLGRETAVAWLGDEDAEDVRDLAIRCTFARAS